MSAGNSRFRTHSSILASRIDGSIFVVDESRTKRPDAQAALNQLAKVRANVLGIRAGWRGLVDGKLGTRLGQLTLLRDVTGAQAHAENDQKCGGDE